MLTLDSDIVLDVYRNDNIYMIQCRLSALTLVVLIVNPDTQGNSRLAVLLIKSVLKDKHKIMYIHVHYVHYIIKCFIIL